MKTHLIAITFLFISLNSIGQKNVDTTQQVAFVYFENRKTNFIVIPNIDRLSTFKIYRKLNTDSAFIEVAVKKKPPLPMRYNVTSYGVTWEDKEYNTRNIDYQIIAFDKKGNRICELKIMWEKE